MVTLKKLPIRWDKLAKESLDDIYNYINQDSPQSARKVKKGLIKLVGSLNDFPDKYSKEEFLEEEPGNYRSISKWSIRLFMRLPKKPLSLQTCFARVTNARKLLGSNISTNCKINLLVQHISIRSFPNL